MPDDVWLVDLDSNKVSALECSPFLFQYCLLTCRSWISIWLEFAFQLLSGVRIDFECVFCKSLDCDKSDNVLVVLVVVIIVFPTTGDSPHQRRNPAAAPGTRVPGAEETSEAGDSPKRE